MCVAAGLLSFGSAPIPSAASAEPLPTCTLEPGPVATVSRVLDAETLVLDTGKAVRLIGALAPRARDAGAERDAWPPETAAVAFLSDLVLGKKVRLAFGGRSTDRYGRYLAQVFVEDRGLRDWVQGNMLAAGHARAYGLPESFACARELMAHEAEAREKRRGLWGNGVYRTMSAEHPGPLMAQRERYVLVRGDVQTVGVTKSATYLNFGADRRTDFTVRIGKRVLAAHPDLASKLQAQEGRTVIIRGWIERRNGPQIDVSDPSQIEMLDEDDTPGVAHAPVPGAAKPANVISEETFEPEPDDATDRQNELRPAPLESAEPGAVNL
ncbi:thermonuclease family protein [Hyphomicrobium methylovorum]|uniref:thermonuclease family protein n=1 Tax=Hyphomicrobium methylovorum TaxID=84 RepID=UPI001FEB7239|nr:thermonuclease family protein [Hyphomicrobium methylovorum]